MASTISPTIFPPSTSSSFAYVPLSAALPLPESLLTKRPLLQSLWTLLVLIYLFISIRMTHITHPFATLALCAVTMIFWFAGFIAVAVAIGAAVYCVGICGVFAAAAAFGAFLW